MTDLNFLNAKFAADHYPDLVDQIERCPVQRFVKKENLPFFKNIFLSSAILSEQNSQQSNNRAVN